MAVSLLLSFIVVFLPTLIHQTSADPRTDIIARMCRQTHVQNVSNYIESYTKILSAIEGEMYRDKFGIASSGDPPDKLFVLSQCMDDLSSEECEICFSQANTLLPGCFPATGGRVYLDGCFVRAENYSFYTEAISPDDSKTCGATSDDTEQYREATKRLILKLLGRAPHNKGYAERHEKCRGVSVYGMAMCLKSLDHDKCAGCLMNAAEKALSCLPSVEARVLNAGCFLRYSDYEFRNNPNTRAARDTILLYGSYVLGTITICTLAITIGFFIGKLCYRRRNRQSKIDGTEKDLSVLRRSLQFKYSTLEKATAYFSDHHKLGHGGFGEVFKGALPDGREIAIKRLFITGRTRKDEVYNEMDIISRAQHKNLVRFLGCCFTNDDSLLVYEFLANKSLDHVLFDSEKKKELCWKKRLGIIMGTARGLEYLHKDCQARIVHRDIKASNILLDLRYRPKIADFGLARFYSCNRNLVGTAIAGTLGYMAPEYLAEGRLTEKVDIYSYGVVVLEIVSGLQNNKFQPDQSLDTLATFAWRHFQKDTVSEIIDKNMEIEDMEGIKRVVQVGLLCTQEAPSLRPTMTSIIQMLTQKDALLPTPSKPPFMDEAMAVSLSVASSRRHPSESLDSCRSHNKDYVLK